MGFNSGFKGLTPFGTKDIQCKGKVVGVRNYAYAPWRRMRSKGVAPRSLNLSTRKLLTNSLEEGAPSTHRRKGWVNPTSGVDKTRYKKMFYSIGNRTPGLQHVVITKHSYQKKIVPVPKRYVMKSRNRRVTPQHYIESCECSDSRSGRIAAG